ncbi:MAG: hypothetical protein ACTHJM_02980 [Marmoricola sp.]
MAIRLAVVGRRRGLQFHHPGGDLAPFRSKFRSTCSEIDRDAAAIARGLSQRVVDDPSSANGVTTRSKLPQTDQNFDRFAATSQPGW